MPPVCVKVDEIRHGSIVEAIEEIADGATYDESAGQAFDHVDASPHEDAQSSDYGQGYHHKRPPPQRRFSGQQAKADAPIEAQAEVHARNNGHRGSAKILNGQ